MNRYGWLAAGALLVAAVVVAWPTALVRLRSRRRSVLGSRWAQRPPVLGRSDRPAARWSRPVSEPAAAASGNSGTPAPAPEPEPEQEQEPGPHASATGAGGVLLAVPRRLEAAASRRLLTVAPRRLTAAVAVVAGLLGTVAAGPVAGTAAATYGGLAGHLVARRHASRIAQRRRQFRLDGLGALAADLRAGLPAPPDAELPAVEHPAGTSGGAASGGATGGRPNRADDRLPDLVRAAGGLAERTGAPLADLLERIEADARAMDRGLAAASAQAAGARATAGLLAVLPFGGIALGYGIGVDPLRVLLHTPVGGACAIAAIVLQLAGLAWTDRLSRPAMGAS